MPRVLIAQPTARTAPEPRLRSAAGGDLFGGRSLALAIHHENLEDTIYTHLRALIRQRRILPGERIPLDRVARIMGVSRTPVLNALKRLAQERVVELRPRRGVYVRRFTKREMARLFAVREALEGLSARLAATRIQRAELDCLAELFQGFDGPPTPAMIRRYVERDRQFHWRLVEIAGNEHLAEAMDSVNMMFFVYQDGLVRPPAETLPEHRAILQALRRRDADGSEAAMRLHIRHSVGRLEKEADAEEAAVKASRDD